MGETFIRLDPNDFQRIGVSCSCGSEVVFNADAERGPGEVFCPNCSKRLESAEQVVLAFRRFRVTLKASPHVSTFLVVPTPEVKHP